MEYRIEELEFKADGFRLRGTLHLPPGRAAAAVIGCHGLLSDRRSPKQLALAEECNRLGMAFFRFDHRGCGESEGRLEADTSLEDRCQDLLEAIRLLAARDDIGDRLGLFGSSMGGSVCLLAASRLGIKCLVTFAAPVRSRPLHAGLPASGGLQTLGAVLKESFDLAPHLGRVGGLLVLHGAADEVVPIDHAHEIFAAAGEPKRLVVQPNGDHLMSDPRHQAEFIREASQWLARGSGAQGDQPAATTGRPST